MLIEVPRHQKRDIQPLTPNDARTLLESVKNHRLSALVSVAMALGLRLGEALGLRWIDIDFDTGTLSVRQALERSGGDRSQRRPLIAERQELRKQIATAPKRSADWRQLWKQLEALRKRWREVTRRSGLPNRSPFAAVARSACRRSLSVRSKCIASGS